MKTHISILILLGIIFTTGINAQIFTEQELSAFASDQLTVDYEADKQAKENLKAGSTWVTVGSDVNCDYRVGATKIQDAIDDGKTEIRITMGDYLENITIDDVDVKLLGGYANCTDANNDIFNSNTVNTRITPAPGSGKPGIMIEGNTQRNDITLRNLTVRQGEGGGLHAGGGISIINADVFVYMNTLNIEANYGISGGGVFVFYGDADIKMQNVQISSNSANNGGGIYCQGNNNEILFDGDDSSRPATIFLNTASANGGGVYVTGECKFINFVGEKETWSMSGIRNNKADNHGGGIYTSGGAKVYLYGHQTMVDFISLPYLAGRDSEPLSIKSNRADNNYDGNGDGGAIYATGANTSVTASNVQVDSNSGFNGGAIYVTNQAEYTTYAVNPKNCWEKTRCNQYINNKASGYNGIGGAFYVRDRGKLIVTRTHVERNRADWGAAFAIFDAHSTLTLEGSYITGNGSAINDDFDDKHPVAVADYASAQINYTTIADNYSTVASLGFDNGSLRIYSSIIHDLSGADALYVYNPYISTQDCLIVNALGDISGSRIIVDDPEFVDRWNNDYHLYAALSPAVDYCDDSVTQHTTQDSDGEDRGWDDYIATNTYGPFDVGADETYQNDVIFEDEFE